MDQERLFNELKRDMPDFVKIVLLPKSGGVSVNTLNTLSVATKIFNKSNISLKKTAINFNHFCQGIAKIWK